MEHLKAPVGDWAVKKVVNNWEDVETVQELLQAAARKTGNWDCHPGPADGIIFPFSSRTVSCIRAFQSRFMNYPDGVISPGKLTIRKLSAMTGGTPSAPTRAPSQAKVDGSGCCFPLAIVPRKSYQPPGTGRHYRGRYFGAKRWSKKQGGFRKHAGCDLIVPVGTPIYAVDDGKVHHIGYDFLSGKRDNGEEWSVGYVTVIHNNFTVRYAETKTNFPVKKGDTVEKGQKIGEVGMMSRSHMVHFEMYSSNTPGAGLTQRQGQKVTKEFGPDTPFQRRQDLIDPTPYLDKWKSNLPVVG